MRLKRSFFQQDVLVVAPKMLGKTIVSASGKNQAIITEVEAYGGEEDLASHARFGHTKRNDIMYGEGGYIYVYLIYGIYWMFNIVTGRVGEPQAILIRGLKTSGDKLQELIQGPGKVGKWLGLNRSFYGEDLVNSQRIWIESCDVLSSKYYVKQTTRIGVDYAGE